MKFEAIINWEYGLNETKFFDSKDEMNKFLYRNKESILRHTTSVVSNRYFENYTQAQKKIKEYSHPFDDFTTDQIESYLKMYRN